MADEPVTSKAALPEACITPTHPTYSTYSTYPTRLTPPRSFTPTATTKAHFFKVSTTVVRV